MDIWFFNCCRYVKQKSCEFENRRKKMDMKKAYYGE